MTKPNLKEILSPTHNVLSVHKNHSENSSLFRHFVGKKTLGRTSEHQAAASGVPWFSSPHFELLDQSLIPETGVWSKIKTKKQTYSSEKPLLCNNSLKQWPQGQSSKETI